VCNDRELGRIAEDMANHACNVLSSQDNITVTIIMLSHRVGAAGGGGRAAAIGRYVSCGGSDSGSFKGYERKESGQERDYSIGLPRAPSGNYSNIVTPAAVATIAPAHERAPGATQQSVQDDDLMDFLMDDSNF
jgi:hypothetical protein